MHFGVVFRAVSARLRLEVLGSPTPYQLRNSGASWEFAAGTRTLAEVQRRERRPRLRAAREAKSSGALPRHCLPREHRARRVWAALAPGAALVAPVFLEIFNGSGRLSCDFGRASELVLKWDIMLGPACDLTKKSDVLMIIGWVQAGLIKGIHLGTPFTSFSRIRGVGFGPPVVRSDAEPMGFKNLQRTADVELVRLGNILLTVSVQIFSLCVFFKIAGTLENPATSRLWLTPAFCI